jgi:hypothetical protein
MTRIPAIATSLRAMFSDSKYRCVKTRIVSQLDKLLFTCSGTKGMPRPSGTFREFRASSWLMQSFIMTIICTRREYQLEIFAISNCCL